ncbi:MAG: putative Ig domain-containing protein [Planctomycetota bacterium]
MSVRDYTLPLLLLSVLLAVSQRVGAQEALGRPTPIAIGDSVTGDIAADEVREYSFAAPFGAVVYLDRTSASAPALVNWKLCDARGRTLRSDLSGLNDLGPVSLLGGTYTIAVLSEAGGASSFGFTLVDAHAENFTLALDGPATAAAITRPGSRHDYTFSTPPGARVYFDVVSVGTAGVLSLELVDEHGRALITPTSALLDQGPLTLQGGEYRVSVISRLGGVSAYELRLRSVTSDSQSIAIGQTVAGSSVTPGERDRYTFTAAAGQVIALDQTAVSATTAFGWILEDSNGRVLLAQTTNLNDQGPFALLGGDYTVSVVALGTVTGTYSFQVALVTDGAAALPFGTLTSGSIAPAGKKDTYTFTATPGQEIHLDFNSPVASSLNWRLVDALGRSIAVNTTTLGDTGPIALMGGEYSLVVLGEPGQTGTYDVTMVDVVHTVATTSIGATITSAVAMPSQRAEYTFTAAPAQEIRLDLLSSSSATTLNWMIVDSVGREVLARTTQLADTAPIALMGGNYTLTVLPEGSAIASYSFEIVDDGLSGFVPSGGAITAGVPVAGAIGVAGEIDSYTFAATAAQKYYLDLTQGATGLRWSLVDGVGQAIFTNLNATTPTLDDRGPFALVDGTYVLTVFHSSTSTPSYAFTLLTTTDAVTPMSLDVATVGAITQKGSTSTYTLSLASAQQVFIDLTQLSVALQWQLVDAVGTAVFPLTTASSVVADQGPYFLGAGEYELVIDPQVEALPSYTFSIISTSSTVTPLAVGELIDSVFITPGSSHVYELTIPTQQSVYFDLQQTGLGFSWGLFDSTGAAVFAIAAATSATTGDRGPFTLAAGDYSLVLDPTGDDTPDYRFQVVPVADSTQAIALGQIVTGAIAVSGSKHRFEFEIAGEPTTVYLDTLLASAGTWTLRDPNDVSIASDPLTSTATGDLGPFTLAAGVYAIEISAAGGATVSYQFQVHEALDTVATLEVGDTVTDAIPSAGGTARYTFVVPRDRSVIFDIVVGAAELKWSLFDALGEAAGLFLNAATADPLQDDRGPLFLEPGLAYTLVLDGDFQSVPSGTFALKYGTLGDPVVVASEWQLTARLNFARVASAHWNDVDEQLYVGVREGGDDLFLLQPSGVPLFLEASSDAIAAVEIAPSGDAFYSEDGAGRLRKYGGGIWVSGLGAGDDDPAGFAFAPANYSGPLALAGRGVVVDRGDGSEDGVWSFSATTAEGEVLLYPDSGLLVDAVDVTISSQQVYIADAGLPGQTGFVWRLDPGAVLTDIGATGLAPAGITLDPIDDSLLVVDRLNGRVVRVDPANGSHTDVITGVRLPTDGGFACIDLSADGRRMFVTAEGAVYEFRRCAPGAGVTDCNGNGQDDACDLALDLSFDCNQNGVPDECDIAAGLSTDLNGDGVPDECLPCARVDLVFVVDTSTSMNDDAAALCTLLPEVIEFLGANDVAVRAEILGIANTPGGDFACLTANVRDLLGAAIGTDCGAFFSEITEDWGRATEAVCELFPWTPGSQRFVVVISDEGPHCGDGITSLDDFSVAVAITAAQAADVRVSTITGTGSAVAVVDLAAALATGTGGLALTIAESATEIGAAVRDIVISSCPCGAGIAELQPLVGSAFPAGTPVTISGRVNSLDPSRPIVDVFVGGASADSIDLAGRFFKTVTLAVGMNSIAIEVVQSCGSTESTLALEGLPAGSDAPVVATDVTLAVVAEYSDTTFSLASSTLSVTCQGCNVSDSALRGPLKMVIEGFTEPTVSVASPDGVTADGKPYFEFLAAGELLFAGGCTPARTLLFSNPQHVQVLFEATWLAAENRAPTFASSPPTSVAIGAPYSYTPIATDLDGDAVSFVLSAAPLGMAMDALTHVVTWLPSAADLGNHTVAIRASDLFGGSATQEFTLAAISAPANRAPYFTSSPLTHVAVGAEYIYAATAADLDADTLAFELLAAPTGMTVNASGVVVWPFALPGLFDVALQVSDGQGGSALQQYQLAAGAVSLNPHVPQLFGSPTPTAVVDQLYLYQPAAFDSDFGDVLSFTLALAPTGMVIDPATGRVTWIPNATQLGSHAATLAVSDGYGGVNSQSWDIEVVGVAANRAPVILSTPSFYAEVGVEYEYQVVAIDADLDAITYSLVAAPLGMSINGATGLVTWTPTSTGSVTIAIRVLDAMGGAGSQAYLATVIPPNGAPMITSTPATTAVVGGNYRYAAEATDPDGHLIAYSLDVAPAGMNVGAISGLVSWSPTTAQLGPQLVTLRVADPYGASVTQAFTVQVSADTTAPEVTIAVSHETAPFGQDVLITVGAADDVGVASRTLRVDGVLTTLDALGSVIYSAPMPGAFLLEATATDASGNVGVAARSITLLAPDPEQPVVTLIAPQPDAQVSGVVDIVATIADNVRAGLTWTVSLRRDSERSYQLLASGAGPVTAATVAQLDTTLLANDAYWIEILGQDAIGNTGGVQFRVQVVGELKLGQYETTFVDLTIPLAGIPLTITRRYSSLAPERGDFGFGWQLGLAGELRDDAAEFSHPVALVDDLNDEPFQPGTRVHVTLPSGRRVGFTFQPTPTMFGFVVTPRFEPDAGVTETLEALSQFGGTTLLFTGTACFEFIFPYNPREYVLTTEKGVRYTIDEHDGLLRMEDIFGNAIDVTPSGLVSSTGIEIGFERDGQGRITRILEPSADGTPRSGGQLVYTYDANGNLASSTDAAGNTTEYFYEVAAFPHHLTRIEDPLDRPVVRNVFGADGRLVAQCTMDGDIVTLEGCSQVEYDAAAGTQTIFDGNGDRTDLFFDAAGNLSLERRWLGATPLDTVRTYDVEHHLLTDTDPLGNVQSYTYDERGNRLTAEDAAGRMWLYGYDDSDNITSLCDPVGNCISYVFDDQRRPLVRTDALGLSETYTWGAFGLLESVTDVNGQTWLYEYDEHARVERVVHPDGSEVNFVHDALGRLTTATDRNGQTITYEYDAKHRVIEERWHTTPEQVFAFEYNAVGLLTSAAGPGSAQTFEYWPTGAPREVRNESVDGSTAHVVAYGYDDGAGQLAAGYDGNGKVTHVFDSFGGLTEYEYDALGRLDSIRQTGADPELLDRSAVASPVIGRSMRFEYSHASLLTAARRFNDAGGALPAIDTLYAYDCGGCAGRVESIEHRLAGGGAVLHALFYTRDANGDVLSTVDAEGAHTALNDGGRRLLSATHPVTPGLSAESYSYDGSNNRIASHRSASYVYGGTGNQLIEDDEFEYAYDLNGNLIEETRKSNGLVRRFVYDYRNRLTSVRLLTPGGVEIWSASYGYDTANRRIRSVENGVEREYVYDGGNPIIVLDGAGAVLKRRLYAHSIDSVYGYTSGGDAYWYLTDAQGSIRDVVDESGAMARHYVYDSFGAVVGGVGALDDDVRFQSREFSDLTGLGYFRARYYQPTLGRFLSEDPRLPHRYDFAESNPLLFRDPSGKVTAIEYACKAVHGISVVTSVLQITNPVAKLWYQVAAAVVLLEPPPEGGGGIASAFRTEIIKATIDNIIEELVTDYNTYAGCALKAFNWVREPPQLPPDPSDYGL